MKKRRKRGDAIIELLMRRDGITRAEAVTQYESARAEFFGALAGTSCRDPEDVLAEDLGLEPDYIFDFL